MNDESSRASRPTSTPRYMHVAGTKGKGSNCKYANGFLMLLYLVHLDKVKTGLHTSPHLCQVREGICTYPIPVEEGDFASYPFQITFSVPCACPGRRMVRCLAAVVSRERCNTAHTAGSWLPNLCRRSVCSPLYAGYMRIWLLMTKGTVLRMAARKTHVGHTCTTYAFGRSPKRLTTERRLRYRVGHPMAWTAGIADRLQSGRGMCAAYSTLTYTVPEAVSIDSQQIGQVASIVMQGNRSTATTSHTKRSGTL